MASRCSGCAPGARARGALAATCALALIAALVGASPVRAGAGADLPTLDEDAWRAVAFPRIPRHTLY